MKKILSNTAIIVCLFSAHIGLSQSIQPEHDVYILGNSSHIEMPEVYGRHLRNLIDQSGNDWTLVLAGDLINSNLTFSAAIKKLDLLIQTISSGQRGQIVIIPGDEDWANGKPDGLRQLMRLEAFLKNEKYDRVYLPLRHGCPGPYLFPADENLKLLLINTQWINHPHDKPTSETAICDIATEDSFLEEIESLIEETGETNLMVVGHHPLISHGRIGGAFPLQDWFLPVPIISLFLTSHRQNIGGRNDIVNDHFDDFRYELDGLLSDHRSLIYASGHAQNIELFRQDQNVYINSGAPTRGGFVRKVGPTIFATHDPGIVKIKYQATGKVSANSYRYDSDGFHTINEAELFQPPCLLPSEGLPVNQRLIPCLEMIPTKVPTLSYPDHINITANPNYKLGKTAVKFLGQHYRKSWTTPIRANVLDLDSFAGGISPTEIGGGRQTKSLKFKTENAFEYVFRSVDKDPSKALSRDLRSTIISLLIRDQTTTQQPYGALPASKMLDRLEILHARPQLFVMPNNEKLGPFVSEFGGMLGLIEERPTDPKGAEGFAGADDVKRSLNLFRRMYRDRDNQIDVTEFVRARIFDILVGDWGKHEDNWKWAGYKKDKGRLYRPIPRDRDHVFSQWDGLLPWLVDREWAKPSGENFDYEIKGLRSLMWQARHLDRFVASEADRSIWQQQSKYIQGKLDERAVDEAIATLPQEILDTDGYEIGAKLKTRLKDLDRYADEYYQMLAKQVDVVGSNKEERFEVNRLPSGEVKVEMYKLRRKLKDELYYQRTFLPQETSEIRLFGMDGHDQIFIEGSSKKSIPIRIIPGVGQDTVVDRSEVKGGRKNSILYADAYDVIVPGGELRSAKSLDPNAYRYDRTAFKYNTYFPLAYLVFSSDYGLSLSGNVTFTRQRYGKPDFASMHQIGSSISTIGNFKVSYDATWRHVLGSLDLIGGLSHENKRRYRYFFGLGNETVFDNELFGADYYTLQYASTQAYLGLQKSFWKHSHIHLAGLFESNSKQSLSETILEDLDLMGEDQLDLAKLKFELDLDFRDRENLPTRGARLYTSNKWATPLKGEDNTYIVGESKIEYFLTVKPFTLGLRGGLLYSHREVPYYDLSTVGQNRYLRGFRRNRFSGEQGSYINSELRLEILDKPGALVPHKLGLRFFYDQARVSVQEENSKRWHQGYGVGFYFVPLREQFSLHFSFAFSEEEKGLIIFGFGNSF